ncbi:acyl-coenzyme A thioesterase 13-like [Adelges cooleyi]|uniref:acyl-coenzyme A thioesterase 13-like n=1 Tax=Adelges cooleyi TaxID=133065 RepID=UPI00217FA290|nr:acyl-coenzyme A thioesterase 13-like [Adelges cooleyi]XP_050434919.1 acyl-coenzyme A thioesterase 13-like [Adelges cooleyi]XP_050434920.1 acyl-coenzyme A thioesterase 13-like [Adelges cooleyi]XP_050434921.1 acyl-coenzyme A thioesterase 13-like [Adelges cooleyi]XP_050434922.1 acyl-coenzyme A thioesterase 13-like [Adelges cooleyi]
MSSVKALESLKKFLDFSIKRGGFDRIFEKTKLISAGDGKCVAEMVVEKQHTNGFSTLHGGFTASAIDLFSSIAVLTHPKIFEDIDSGVGSGVSVDIHVKYLASAKIGDEIIINADTTKLGRNLAFLEVTMIRKADNVIIAKGAHTKFVG